MDRNTQDPLVHAIMNGLSVIGSEEHLLPSEASGLGLALSLANFERGLYYPGGGHQRIQQALIHAVRVAGGEVIGDVGIDSIAIAENSKKDGDSVVGVKVKVNDDVKLIESPSVISGVGLLRTYTRLLSAVHVSEDTRSKLASLAESRPKVYVVYLIDSTCVSAEELGLRNADYFEVSSEYESMQWLLSKHLDKEELLAKQPISKDSIVNPTYCRISCPSLQDHLWTSEESDGASSRVHAVIVEFEVGEAIVSLKPHRFIHPAKDATTAAEGNTLRSSFSSLNASPKLFVSNVGSGTSSDEISLSRHHRERIISAADAKLEAVYPKIFHHKNLLSTSNSIQKVVINPHIGGYRLANSPSKYDTKISSAADIGGLFFCGKDFGSAGLMGDIQGAWVATNAVLRYSAAELVLGRNITHDLESIPVKY